MMVPEERGDTVFEELNRQLSDVQEKVRQKDKWTSMLQRFQSDLAVEKRKQAEAHETLRLREHEVEKLEGLTIAHLFQTLLGHYQDKVEASQQALLAAKLKYDAASVAVQRLESDIRDLEQRISALGDVEAEYTAVLEKKERAVLESDSPFAGSLGALAEDEAKLRSTLKELDEAVAAAQPALRALDECLESLNKALDWGTWDMLGGGLIATSIKHDHMQNAQDLVNVAAHHLRRFQRELQDVHMDLDIRIEDEGFLHFADYFFDGLIVDWMVQDQLKESKERVLGQRSIVESIVDGLQREYKGAQARLEAVLSERKRLLESLS